ncbi:CBS domain-containing protein [Sphingomonas paeninsulae]|uniref:CBS domain-containing protein n=1 Tax=Sphingomonas paeninsulae TaxID=2319844 RepID=A0A494TQB3_SPHPE|nr:CBS domain-containing protein [Sphingomonas paeninsulae]AYJ87986.1 CBS domain-containing protein [Sphingomonas paeninsulae]
MTISAILSSKGDEVIAVSSDALVADAVKLFAERRIGAVPVIDKGNVVGIFSERDVVYSLARIGGRALDQRVGDVMTSPALTVAPGDPVMAALSLMTRRRVRHLPVIDNGKTIGFVSIGDLVKYRIDRIETEAAAMRDYIAS